jgi:hypothetical protein
MLAAPRERPGLGLVPGAEHVGVCAVTGDAVALRVSAVRWQRRQAEALLLWRTIQALTPSLRELANRRLNAARPLPNVERPVRGLPPNVNSIVSVDRRRVEITSADGTANATSWSGNFVANGDLQAFTRDLAQMERDLGSGLDWLGIAHWNTDNPHLHLLVRGVAQDGSDLVISRAYISHGLRSRAEDLVSIELGPKPEHEIRSGLAQEVNAERWTRLDAAIRMAADDSGFMDLRPDRPGVDDPEARRLAIPARKV